MKEKSITEFFKLFPSEEQKTVLRHIENFLRRSKDDFLILDGSAGTGKTTILAACTDYLKYHKIPFHLAAPTGRAARILSNKARAACTTIHSLIYNVKANPNSGFVNFLPKENEQEGTCIFIIDEASMIPSTTGSDEESMFSTNNPVLQDLISFVKEGNHRNKLIFVGDKNQLPPVKEAFPAALSLEYLQKKFRLTGSYLQLKEVKRQERDNPIFSFVDHLKQVMEEDRTYTSPRKFFESQNQRAAEYSYVSDYTTHGPEYCTAISAAHKINIEFNRNVRAILFEDTSEKLMPQDLLLISRTLKKQTYTLYNGDHVVVRSVDMENKVVIEGLEFVKVELLAKDLDGKEFSIKDYLLLNTLENPKGLSREEEKALRYDRLSKNEKLRKSGNIMDDPFLGAIRAIYGYSMTIHKAQGGEWDKVYLCDWFPNNSLQHQYTAFTRAKKEVLIY